jgi:hypothetical protein
MTLNRRTPLRRGKPLQSDDRHRWRAHVEAPERADARVCERCGRLFFGSDPPERGCPGLRARAPLTARTPLRGVSPRRDAKRAARGVRGPLCARAREQRLCHACGYHAPGGCHAHHVRRVGAGWADRLPDGTGNVAPLCGRCHQRCHDEPGFEASIDTAAIAARFGSRLRTGFSDDA